MNQVPPNLKSILANTSLFGMLSSEQLDEVALNTTSMHLGRNTCVVNQGDTAKGTFWIVYGQIKIGLCGNQGSCKTLEILGQNTCFGLGEMILQKPHLAFMETTVESMLLHVEREVMLQMAEENFDFARELMTCMGRQFYGLVRDIESYSETARYRLAGYLMRQSWRETSDQIELVANKGLIASRLSLTPETLSRLFRDFSSEGLIQVSGRHIKILDPKRMSAVIS